MFGKRSKKKLENQLPADLIASIHEPQTRRRRWIVEILVSLVIVVGLVGGGMLLYRKFHHEAATPSVPTPQANPVVQPPQQSTDKKPTGEPEQTQASDTTNNNAVTQPN